MSGQWQPQIEQTVRVRPAGWLHEQFEQAVARERLRDAVNQLLPDEVAIAAVYVESLLKTRPIKQQAREGWVTTIDGPGYVEKEDRAHMAVLELENDPR